MGGAAAAAERGPAVRTATGNLVVVVVAAMVAGSEACVSTPLTIIPLDGDTVVDNSSSVPPAETGRDPLGAGGSQ